MLVVICGVMVIGIALLAPRLDDKEARGSLGASLLTGAGISLAFFFLNNSNEANRKSVADQQTLRLALGTTRDLQHADLHKKDLRKIDFGGKNLAYANLRGANLTKVNLNGANLTGTRLDGARLHGAKLIDAQLPGAVLNGADLSRANLFDANLTGAALGPARNGRPANLSKANLIDGNFRGACLAHANLRHATLGGTDLREAVLTGADLRGAHEEHDGLGPVLGGAVLAGVHVDEDFSLPGFSTTKRISAPRPASSASDEIVSVSDGDTIELRNIGWVRLIGIDAPQDVKRGVGKQGFDFLAKQMKKNASVRYQAGSPQFERRGDTSGRARGYVWLANGDFLNGVLLEGGYAGRRREPDEKNAGYDGFLEAGRQRARVAGARIWATCPTK